MEIILDEKLKEYLKDKENKKIIINNISTRVCCGNLCLPVARLGTPDDTKDYYLFHLDEGIEVYVQKGVDAKDNKLHLNLKNFILFKDIEIEGIKLL
ncbi:MAG: hypothetical protein JM58_09000 [Peptococcaceae bacterium BICA1-8]|nr:MAG: hypothetical protein JM58_09000 [Peptococcaceae bacterium BICA1-8]